jgi:hypothetical protein
VKHAVPILTMLATLACPAVTVAQETLMVEPFVIDIPEPTLDDLRDRLERTRLPDAI